MGMLSLSARGGGGGFGLRPVKSLFYLNSGKRAAGYFYSSMPAFARNERIQFASGTATVHNATSGAAAGSVTATTIIGGTSPDFLARTCFYSKTDSCWYFLATNTTGYRIVKALPNGTITTLGAAVNTVLSLASAFLYEAGANLILRCSNSDSSSTSVITISKATGQPINTTLDDQRPVYVSEDGRVGLFSISYVAFDAPLNSSTVAGQSILQINGLYYEPTPGNGITLPKIRISPSEMFGHIDLRASDYLINHGAALPDTVIHQAHAALSGEAICWMDATHPLKPRMYPMCSRAELNRWLTDLAKKFLYYSE